MTRFFVALLVSITITLLLLSAVVVLMMTHVSANNNNNNNQEFTMSPDEEDIILGNGKRSSSSSKKNNNQQNKHTSNDEENNSDDPYKKQDDEHAYVQAHLRVINDALANANAEEVTTPAKMNRAKSISENKKAYYNAIRNRVRRDDQKQKEYDNKIAEFYRRHPDNIDFVEEQLLQSDLMKTINNRTNDQCVIHCPRCHRWSVMGDRCIPFGEYPSRREAEQCLWHYYHPFEVQRDKFKEDLLRLQIERVGKKSLTDSATTRKQIFVLAGDNGVGKTHLVQTVSMFFSQHYYSDDYNTHKKTHNKGDALLEIDCGAIETRPGTWESVVNWVASLIEAHIKKDFRNPFIVINDLQKCKKRTVQGLIVPLLSTAGSHNPLFKTLGLHLPPMATIFVTMDMGNVGQTLGLTSEQISEKVEKMIIEKYGYDFQKLVAIYPFETWRQDQYVWALKRNLDNIPCGIDSKVRKISYTIYALAWYAEEIYHAPGTEYNNGRKVADYFEKEIESNVDRAVANYEKQKRLRTRTDRRAGGDNNNNGAGWFGSFFSQTTSAIAQRLSSDYARGYTVIIEWIPYVHDKPHIRVVEEGRSPEEKRMVEDHKEGY